MGKHPAAWAFFLGAAPPLSGVIFRLGNNYQQGEMMKIVISAKGPNLEAQVDPRFGRSSYFLLVNPESMEYEVLTNGQNLQAAQGAGIQAAAQVARRRPDAVLTGNCGPKAFHTLQAAGIQVIVGLEGSVRDVVRDYQAGKLTPAKAPNVTGHWR
jgi:predicted Fe-Mo cluster-binding NifX family protein